MFLPTSLVSPARPFIIAEIDVHIINFSLNPENINFYILRTNSLNYQRHAILFYLTIEHMYIGILYSYAITELQLIKCLGLPLK